MATTTTKTNGNGKASASASKASGANGRAANGKPTKSKPKTGAGAKRAADKGNPAKGKAGKSASMPSRGKSAAARAIDAYPTTGDYLAYADAVTGVLKMLAKGPASQSQLRRSVPYGNYSKLSRDLHADGLIETSETRLDRSATYVLTAKGRKSAAKAKAKK